ncbi:MAG: ATP phosphoribosyltransferase regulatory subunit [Lachnospiraceae bacterium]|jgi:ATP phosphoribosyltransferase regulatory subunit
MNILLHTPDGVRDTYGEECMSKKLLADRLTDVLHLYGYQDIETPTFEFYEIFSDERGTVPARNMYRFIDRDGSTLVLRPDITPSIARAVAKYYGDEEIPLRFAYCGNVFVNNPTLQGKLKETTQIGAELIGNTDVEGDAEMIALSINLLKEAGLSEFQIDVGHVGYFNTIAKEAGIEGEALDSLRSLIENKNSFGAESLLETLHVPQEQAEILAALPELFGDDNTIERARAMTKSPQALAVLDYLEKIYNAVCEYGFEKYVTIDLGMLSEYDYYTGIIFRGYTYGTGDALVKGGRYDRLIGQFGAPKASVGFAAVLDELILALSRQHIALPEGPRFSMVLYEPPYREQAVKTANSLREIRRPVSMLKREPDRTISDYIEYGRRFHMESILYIDEDVELTKIDILDGSRKKMPL